MLTELNREFNKKINEFLRDGWTFSINGRIGSVGVHTALLLEKDGKFTVVFYRTRTVTNPLATLIEDRYDIGVGNPPESFRGNPLDICTIEELQNKTVWTYCLENGNFEFAYVKVQGTADEPVTSKGVK